MHRQGRTERFFVRRALAFLQWLHTHLLATIDLIRSPVISSGHQDQSSALALETPTEVVLHPVAEAPVRLQLLSFRALRLSSTTNSLVPGSALALESKKTSSKHDEETDDAQSHEPQGKLSQADSTDHEAETEKNQRERTDVQGETGFLSTTASPLGEPWVLGDQRAFDFFQRSPFLL